MFNEKTVKRFLITLHSSWGELAGKNYLCCKFYEKFKWEFFEINIHLFYVILTKIMITDFIDSNVSL
jgi:hypothetical protein